MKADWWFPVIMAAGILLLGWICKTITMGRTCMTGWSLPVTVVERLAIWQEDKSKQQN